MHTAVFHTLGREAYPLHTEHTTRIRADAATLFDHLDDPRRLGGHMEKPSWRTLGSSMRYGFDGAEGRSVGAEIRMEGQLFGHRLALTEVVTERERGVRKTWQTTGAPRLIVIGGYRMGFTLRAVSGGSELRVFIDYELGPLRPAWLCAPLARWYARWCVKTMAEDARRHFG